MSEEKKEEGNGDIFSEPLDIKGEKTVGEILLEARERSGLSLDAVSQETRLPKKSLEYLETDNFESIPAKVYVTGFLRTYAGVLGLDVSQILNKYEVQTGQTHRSKGDCWELEESTIEETIRSPKVFKRYFLPAIAIILLVIIIWIVSRSGSDGDGPSDGTDTSVRNEEAPVREGSLETGGEDLEVSKKEEAVPAAPPSGGGGKPEDSAALKADEEPAVGEKDESGEFELRIIANKEDTTWFDVVIYTGDGSDADSTFRDFILYPGTVESFRTEGSILFRTIGNAGGFKMERDGQLLPSFGSRGLVRKNIRITRSDITRE